MRYWVSDNEDEIGRSMMAESADNAVERALASGAVKPDRHLWVRWDMRKTRSGAFLACRLLEIVPESTVVALEAQPVVVPPPADTTPAVTPVAPPPADVKPVVAAKPPAPVPPPPVGAAAEAQPKPPNP